MRRKFISSSVIALSSVLIISGCQTTNPYTREKQASNTTKGAAIGAASGAVLGLITSSRKNRQKNALIAAGVGALAGALIGNYMDEQEAALRQELEASGVSVTRDGDRIILNMPSNITFDFGSSSLKPDFTRVLNGVALVLKKYESTLVVIEGHTDSVGSSQNNQILSERRALSVGNYLNSQNIMMDRIMMGGYGETRPIASNTTEAGRARNRRVEITLEPLSK